MQISQSDEHLVVLIVVIIINQKSLVIEIQLVHGGISLHGKKMFLFVKTQLGMKFLKRTVVEQSQVVPPQ